MRCAAYARYSSDLQRQTSIEDQVAAARDFATRQGWQLLEDRVYTDAAISGASLEGRPGIQSLLSASRRRPLPFDVLLVDDSSRVARDLADALRVMQELRFAGIRVIYISQGIDSASEQAETLITVHGLVDGLYLRELAAKTRRGLLGQAERGFSTGARSFGYGTVPVLDPAGRLGPDGHPLLQGKRWVIDEAEAAVIRQAYVWYAAGAGVRTIVARLNASQTRQFSYTAIRGWLCNDRYRGRHIWNRRRFERRPGSRARMARELPESEWKVIEHPELRIIDETLWAAVQARRAAVRAHLPPHGLMRGKNGALHSRHLFSGFMRCGLCGGTIAVVSGGYGSPRYGCVRNSKQGAASCSNKLTIRARVADAALLSGLQAFLREPHTIDALTNLLNARLNAVITARPRLQALRVAERDVLRRKLLHLINAIEDGAATPALLNTMRTREKELAELDAELDALEEPLADRLAVIPSWVRRQVSDVAGILSARPERAKAEFQRLGIAFTVSPVLNGRQSRFCEPLGSAIFRGFWRGQEPISLLPSHRTLDRNSEL